MWAAVYWTARYWAARYWPKAAAAGSGPISVIAVEAIYDQPRVQGEFDQPAVNATFDHLRVQAGGGQ